MFKKILKFINAKKSYFPPKKTKILFFDNIFFEEFSKFFDSRIISKIDIRVNELNLYVIIYTFFFKLEKLTFHNYLKNYISLTQCKIVITGNDNYIFFYSLKNFFPEKKFISIQNGFRNFTFFQKLKKQKNLKADYIFAFNKSFCDLFRKFVLTKTIVSGSFRNNTIKINKKKKMKSFLFISNGNPAASPSMLHGRFKFNVKKFFSSDLRLLNYTQEYCERNKIILKICLKFYGEKGNRELNYFRENIRNRNVKFLIKTKSKDVSDIYQLADKNLLTISTHSTFGLENLSRLNRTAIFNNKIKPSYNVMNLFWNYKLPKNGDFWSDGNFNKKKVNSILNNLKNMKSVLWERKVKSLANKFMIYDYQNKIIFNKINELLKEE